MKTVVNNPHWIGDECCRDYQIGNITLKSVPDTVVMRMTAFRGGYGFAKGNISEFVSECKIEIPYDQSFKISRPATMKGGSMMAALEGMIEEEMCFLCGDPTGRSGKSDDSIYSKWIVKPPTLHYEIGDDIGPLCSHCYDALTIVGVIV